MSDTPHASSNSKRSEDGWTPVAYERNGVCVEGQYKVENQTMTVTCATGSKTAQVSRLPHNALARFVLSELISPASNHQQAPGRGVTVLRRRTLNNRG